MLGRQRCSLDAGAVVDVAAKEPFGSNDLKNRTLDLLSNSLSAETLKSYAGKLSQFAEVCQDSENISPLRRPLPLSSASKRVAEGDADYDRKGKRPAQPAAVEAPSRTIHAPEDGWLDKDALRINNRGKKLHVEHVYGVEVAKEFDAVDPLGGKGSADYKELKKAIEKVTAKKPSSSSSREKPSSSSREPESFHRGSDDRREGGRREEKSPSVVSATSHQLAGEAFV
eukprot:jgi/Tetstr1/449123/TSEL_036333.t1